MHLNILLAEDDAHIRHFFIHGLCRQHAPVTAVSDGQQAIDRLANARYRFDLVISDVEMPRLDGWGLLAWVREHEAMLPVVNMSGVLPGAFIRTACENGARGAIPKPALLLHLHAVLMALFDGTGQPRLTPFYH